MHAAAVRDAGATLDAAAGGSVTIATGTGGTLGSIRYTRKAVTPVGGPYTIRYTASGLSNSNVSFSLSGFTIVMTMGSTITHDQLAADHVGAGAAVALHRAYRVGVGSALGGNYVNRFNIDGRSYKVIPQIERRDVFPGNMFTQAISAGTNRPYLFNPGPLTELLAAHVPVDRIEDLEVPYVAVMAKG